MRVRRRAWLLFFCHDGRTIDIAQLLTGTLASAPQSRVYAISLADGAEHGIRVSQVADLEHASIACSGLDRFEEAGRLTQYLDLMRATWRNRDYGDAWPYMMVAEGLVDVAGEFGLQPYDMAALFPIVQEAGGTFTSMDGEAGPWHGSALATNGRLHEAVRTTLSR